jgi:asparagine synthase (glutamine-hydrolysing)
MLTSSDDIQITISGHIHNLSDLCTRLGIAKAQACTTRVLVLAWRHWGEAMAEHLVGDFALALHDNLRGVTYLARDPLGVKPLYYHIERQQLHYGFSVPELKRLSPRPLTKDADWAATYLLDLSFSQTESAYKEIKKLAPGCWARFDAEGRVNIQRYHRWRDDPPFSTHCDSRWVDDYREILEESIRCRMEPHHPMGTENSGGIDSATITAYLAHFLGEPGDRLHSFSFALCEHEPAYILETSQAKRIRHNYVITDRYGPADQESRVAQSLAAIGYPEEHANASGHIPFYEECQKRGIRTLFSGFGGDEIVTNTGQHLRFELLDRHQYGALWKTLQGNPLMRTLRLLKAATVSRRSPSANLNFIKAWTQRLPQQLLRPEIVQRLELYERYMEAAVYDAPYRRTNDFILQHHLGRMQIAARLESCCVMAAAYGVDYRWPLWDARLVQQYLSTPSIEKFGPKGIGRYLHRRAIDGIVPKRVAWKQSKDMGYALLHQKKNGADIQQLAKQAQTLESRLHPALEALIDRQKFRGQIARAEKGSVDNEFGFMFRRSFATLSRLNEWLDGL